MIIIKYLLTGALLTLLFPPFFILPIGFVLFPIICYQIDTIINKNKKLNIFYVFFLIGLGFFTTSLIWIINPFFVFEETKYYFPISFALPLIITIIFSLVATCLIFYLKNIPSYLLVPLIFIITEFLVSRIFYGFPWITFASVISSLDNLLILVKYFGTLFSSFIIIIFFCLPYIFLVNKKKISKHHLFYPIIFIFIIVLTFSELSDDKNSNIKYKSLSIKTFQLNLSDTSNLNKQYILKKINNLISSSKAEILIFSENNYPYLIDKKSLNELSTLLKKNQTLIIGGSTKDKGNFYNSLFSISKSNYTKFDKKILVPFGEFLPLRDYLNFLENISGPFDFYPGKNNRFIELTNEISFIPIICYEIIFYWKIINSLNEKSNFIINITNDIWFGNMIGPYQHLYLVKLRAAEFNKTIIRVSNNGISSIISNEGKILKNTSLNKEEYMKTNIEVDKNNNFIKFHTIYSICIMFYLFFLCIYNFKFKNE